MEKIPQALLIGLLIGIPLGSYVALISNRHDKVHGGVIAQIFHIIGAICLTSAPPTVLAVVFSGGGFLPGVLTAFSLIVVALIALFLHALFEHPARERSALADADRGWTAEKAKSSGL